MVKALCLALMLLAAPQELEFSGADSMPRLAEQAIAAHRADARDPYLNVLFRLQLVAGHWAEAGASIRELRELRRDPTLFVQYEIYAAARQRQASGGLSFDEAFKAAFREIYGRLDDRTAHAALFSFGANLDGMRGDLDRALDQHRGKSSLALADAVDLIRKYQVHEVYRGLLPLAPALVAEDDARRYVVDESVLVTTRDGASVAAMVVRPRAAAGRLPTLMSFTIYANREWSFAEARKTAAHGYAGVVAYTRGKGRSPDAPVPFEHDGDDAADTIDWISRQSWSDGRVGMFGGSYDGFAQWAAAKRRPPALKAIMPSVPVAPGIDYPMEGNVFLNFPYKWLPYVTNTKGLDDATYNDEKRWASLDRTLYTTGQPYRALERIDGRPNPFFRRWLDHPSYDAYWRRMIPHGEEFARIDIPVLTTTGYYDGCLVSALYYFSEHTKHNPKANHYLVVGPYDHIGAQRRSSPVLMGYEIDRAATIDIEKLRYEWFDFVLKGGPKPALLDDRVNYQVMGADTWRHAPSLAAMSNGAIRIPVGPSLQRVDLADRSDVDRTESPLIVNRTLDTGGGLSFVSEPVAEPVEVSGLFSGQLDFVVNKRDMDVNVVLYELMPSGEYFQLSTYLARVSYAKDRSRRRLLEPGRRERLAFTAGRMTSRKLQAGSRLVIVLRINKQSGAQINYGTGRDVSDESIRDARTPLEVRWQAGGYVDIPVRR